MYEVEEGERRQSQRPEHGPEGEPRPGKPLDPWRIVRSLFRRKWVILGAAVFGMLAGVVVAKTLVPQTFEAKTVMVWEPETTSDAEVRELQTLIDSVKLPTNLAKLRKKLEIPATLEQLSERIRVQYDNHSNLVTVAASASSAERAAQLADTTVEIFRDYQRQLEKSRREEQVAELQSALERARQELKQARQKYDDFRRKHNITDLSAERQQAIEQVATLRAEADMAEQTAATQKARAETAAGQGGGARAPASSRLEQLRAQLTKARARLSEQHPRVQSLAAEVDALDNELKQKRGPGGSPAVASAKAQRKLAEQKQEHYEKLRKQAQQRLEKLSDVEGEASELLASVQVAENRVMELEGDLAEAQQAAREPASGFRVVAPAIEPGLPTESMRKPIAMAIPTGVMVLTLLFLVGYELWGLRAVTASEVAYWGRAAVIGSSTWPKDAGALNSLVDELGDDASGSKGTTLIVGATSEQRDYAEQLANRLQLMTAFPESVEDSEPVDDAYYDPETGTVVKPQPEPVDRDRDEAVYRDAASGALVLPRGSGGSSQLAPWRGDPDPAGRVVMLSVHRGDNGGDRLAKYEPHVVQSWDGADAGPSLRKAARRADRVLVVVPSGKLSASRLLQVRTRLGREDPGVGFVVAGLPSYLTTLPDRVGPVAAFWRSRR